MSIVVTVESAPSREIAASWAALVQRAAGNVFADPAALRAAEATSFSRPRTLLAWAERDGAPTLVGAWSFSTRRLLPCCAILTAPAYKYAFAGTPVLDPHASDAATAAFLDAIVADRTLPKVLRLKDVDADSSGFAALMRLDKRQSRHRTACGTREQCARRHPLGHLG